MLRVPRQSFPSIPSQRWRPAFHHNNFIGNARRHRQGREKSEQLPAVSASGSRLVAQVEQQVRQPALAPSNPARESASSRINTFGSSAKRARYRQSLPLPAAQIRSLSVKKYSPAKPTRSNNSTPRFASLCGVQFSLKFQRLFQHFTGCKISD